jgi:hypothetical protein
MNKFTWLYLGLILLLFGCQQQETETATAVSPPPTALQITSPSATPHSTEVAPEIALPATATAIPTVTATAVPQNNIPDIPGALIGVSMSGQVGVLLDEFPVEMRDRVVTAVLDQSEEVWLARAARQLRLTRLRLNFRNFSNPDKGQLPLPPPELWQIQLDPAGPARQTIQGHDMVLINYTFATTILTDDASPGLAEPALSAVDGIWEEPFIFPADPDLLLQRTGNACVNEGGFPPNSFDSENAWHFYDFDCEADSGGALGCHRTILPNLSCREALAARIGEVETSLRFERLPWNDELAVQVRTGSLTSLDTPDLMVVGDDLETNRIIYRYLEPDDCAVEEGAVGGSGWRRLLQFDATVYNVGGQTLHIGPVVSEDPVNHIFDYNACHDHFHYSNYGDFFLQNLDQLTGSKQAFCVQSTNRLSNNETSPLTHDYSCRFQGVQAGWVDEYIAGLDAQWIDITDLDIPDTGQTVQLGFTSNGDQFLCEGTAVTDEDGTSVWEPTEFTTEAGEIINRPQCEFIADWDANNEAIRDAFVPAVGSFVTAPCSNDEAGPLRNCDFTELTAPDLTCRPGESVTLSLRAVEGETPQVVRICEWSDALGVGVACTYEDALANAIINDEGNEVTFTCPRIRDAGEEAPGGGFALYSAPVWTEDTLSPIAIEK